MTTSVLSHLAGDLHGNDLQTLRDFALDAPWEWQRALNALIDQAEGAETDSGEHEEALDDAAENLEKVEGQLKELRSAAEGTVEELRNEMQEFFTTKMDADDRTSFADAVNKALDTLEKASDE